ncbi:MAG: alkaline shock response membrane anchor protein AmaP [Candidatus Omnitrophota bacterium]
MVFFKKLGVLIYAILIVCAGALFILLSAGIVSTEQWSGALNALNVNLYAKAALGCAGGLFVLIGITAPFRVARKLQSSRIIAFQNPDGEVTISLSAIEEYIKKIAGGMDEIKDVRSRVNTSRKGINIVCDVAILPGANIPEVTEKMQAAVKNKLSGMIGVEEKINIKMNINKIAKGPMEPGSVLEEEHVPHVPFREMS